MLGAFALMALRRGGDQDDADAEFIGALLVAEHFALIRSFLGPKKR